MASIQELKSDIARLKAELSTYSREEWSKLLADAKWMVAECETRLAAFEVAGK